MRPFHRATARRRSWETIEQSDIGAVAADLVGSGDHIYLDSGTTVLKLAEALALKLQGGTLTDVVVLTSSLVLIEALARWCKVLLVGGEVPRERRDVCGSISEEILGRFHITRASLGADAVHLTGGFMTTDERTARLDQIVLKYAVRSCVLLDAEEFNRDSFVSYAALGEVELVITDSSIGPAVLAAFRDAGACI